MIRRKDDIAVIFSCDIGVSTKVLTNTGVKPENDSVQFVGAQVAIMTCGGKLDVEA